MSHSLGTCEIKIDLVHPRFLEDETAHMIAPDEFRGMAGWLIQNCVQGAPSVGGLVTKNISRAINYLSTPNVNLDPIAYRTDPVARRAKSGI